MPRDVKCKTSHRRDWWRRRRPLLTHSSVVTIFQETAISYHKRCLLTVLGENVQQQSDDFLSSSSSLQSGSQSIHEEGVVVHLFHPPPNHSKTIPGHKHLSLARGDSMSQISCDKNSPRKSPQRGRDAAWGEWTQGDPCGTRSRLWLPEMTAATRDRYTEGGGSRG